MWLLCCFNLLEIDHLVMTFQNQMHAFLTLVKTEQLVTVFWSMNTIVNALLIIMVTTATLVSILSGIREHSKKHFVALNV